ncbi:S-layer homology domain-containing protein [Caldalkalibacillus horti]|uniref:Uncharacterized protein YkwD n=1 Tax=Caldalkalibacillus horti TaxID=77523 RepID=A0ABT9VU58_9BACI|nr:S-layer homology domain-containing protein [Bacillus horti]MDQ0164515.1 uncharacterized protein YkwD [Bacillus horti]
MKKYIISILSFFPILYFTLLPAAPAQAESPFTDISSHHWAYPSIQWAIEHDIVAGYPDGTFQPNKAVSEAEFLKMFIQTYRQVDSGSTVKHWADPFYAIAQENNFVVKGYNDNSFRNQLINRQSVAEIIAGADGTPHLGDNAVQYLLDKGYSQGKTARTVQGYQGQDSLTRAEAIQFIKNVKEQGMQDIQARPNKIDMDQNAEKAEEKEKKDHFSNLFATDGMYALTKQEAELAQLINEYRVEQGLTPFKLSKSLTKVARYHVYDSIVNLKTDENCNLHSWSNQGKWTGGCYTRDHSNAALMWDKPKEITDGVYSGNGYEISYWHSSEATPDRALAAWKNSSGHNQVMVGTGSWSDLIVMGIAIDGSYAHVWFGMEEDVNGYFSQ